ncbi:hypothetical protein [Hirschia litorea]|uniref:Uncharacterized protein n=1 Tax=Hirschia litorea TaxID=1199156 RepID=A0ABW2IHH2_9PROT
MFSRIFLMFAAVLFTAGPVMACCLTEHAHVTTYASVTDQKDCHNTMEHSDMATQGTQPDASHSTPECMGCSDCDIAFAQENAFQSASVDLTSQIIKSTPLYVENTHLSTPKRTIFTTGPPRASQLRATISPIDLKQRLLI